MALWLPVQMYERRTITGGKLSVGHMGWGWGVGVGWKSRPNQVDLTGHVTAKGKQDG